jgi:putative membrane protein
MKKPTSFHYILLFVYFLVLLWSAINPKDYFTWFLEVFPALIGLILLVFTFRKFSFTKLAYILILVHCCILMVGGHYTYAEVPLFDWIKELLHQSRNNYDKVGHLAQGFVPVIIARELMIRLNVVQKKGWLNFLTVAICMSISVLYEFLEWFVAVATGTSADAFLGTQGYIWDTQSDMLWATIGALLAVVTLGKIHNKQIRKITTQ